MTTTLTIHLDDDVTQKLDQLSETTQRSAADLATDAVRELVALAEWQHAEIVAAVAEADAGLFASTDDVVAVAQKWGVDADLVAALRRSGA